MTIQEQLDALRRKVEGIGDPRLQPLLDVLRVKCPGTIHAKPSTNQVCGVGTSSGYSYFDVGCEGTGYITRRVDDWPEGAVAGMLLEALWSVGCIVAEQSGLEHPLHRGIRRLISELATYFGHSLFRESPDAAAIAAVSEAVDRIRKEENL